MSACLDASPAQRLLDLKAAYLMPCVYHFYKRPPVIVGGEGNYLVDSVGKRYLDCYSGVTVMNAGHSKAAILSAALEQMHRFQHTTTIYLTEPMFRLAEKLAQLAPRGIARSFFCASGSEANEAALLLATLATGRQGLVALRDSLHGRTKWAMSVTGLDMWRTDAAPVDGVTFAPHAHCARCPLGKAYPVCNLACADAVEQCILEAGPDSIAALIAEPIQGNGGIVVPPVGYWQRIREICTRHGILLIFDEVQTAMNRTGRWFAAEHWNVVPDIVTVAKALGNGFPIAAMMAREEVAQAYVRPGASTFGANPVSCAAALATLDFHESHHLGQCAAERGKQLEALLLGVAFQNACLTAVRGKGLMLGVDVVDESGQPDPGRCDACLERLKDLGFLAGKTGRDRNTLTFMPPLTIEDREIAAIAEALHEASQFAVRAGHAGEARS